MAGYSRPAPLPTMMKTATIDPFTGRQLTKQRPFTAMEKYEYLNPTEGRTGAMRALPPWPGVGTGLAARPRRQVTAPGFTAGYAPDDGRRIGSKTGALPALTADDWFGAKGGLGNPAASSRVGSLDPFYEDNPDAAYDWMRKGGTSIPGFGEGWASDEIKGYADGGVIPQGDWALVGERGPELVRSTGNTAVVPLAPFPGMEGFSGTVPVPEVPSAEHLTTFLKQSMGQHATEPTRAAVRDGGVVGYSSGLPPWPGPEAAALVAPGWVDEARQGEAVAALPPLPGVRAPAAPLPAWNPPPRELLGQAPEPGSVPVLNPAVLDPWLQTKVNHIATRELARNPMELVKLQMGIESAQSQAQARAQEARMKELGLDRRAALTQEGLSTRQEQTQKFQREQGEAKLAREKEEKLIKDAAAGEALAVNAIIARSLAAQGKVPKELAEAIAGMKSVEEQNQALNRVDYGSTGRAFAQGQPLAPSSTSGPPQEMEPAPVQWDPTTGKPTRYELRPKKVEFNRDKTMEQLVKLYGIRDSLERPLPESARPRIEREIARLEQALDADGDGKPDGAGVAPAGAAVAPGAGGVAPAGGGVVPKWQERLKGSKG